MAAKLLGVAPLIAVDLRPERLALARRFGAAHSIDASKGDAVAKILEFVPGVFPEDWQSPGGYDELNRQQRQAYLEIADAGIQVCPGPVIQKVIKLALQYREQYSK